MKALLKWKALFLVIIIGLFSSCKNNDGYSDTIDTNSVPVDTVQQTKDTTEVTGTSSGGISPAAKSIQITNMEKEGVESTAGTGTGPGESATDGSTYTPSSGIQKDSIKLQTESAKRRKNKK
ncbi:hypothetical protein [Flavobacterium phragmitis]|uniref:Uncharacterized protein n=1 Tax=Flavobacterium phragmitis TaxID=739143 RepID=A0A1I1NDS2_9FLAO|nr:hypothetical protein [Flavobacterium phragmitis]SFC95635.1 hypothetical protein SAMN05216297_103227 [Flavobacterium phragmitis]